LHRLAPAPRRVRPAGKAARDHGLELGANRLGEDRCRAIGRNADDERGAIDDGAEREIAMRGPVDHIHRNAGGASGAREAFRVGVVLEASDRNSRA